MSACGDDGTGSDEHAASGPPPPQFASDEQRAGYALVPREEVPAEVKRVKDKRNRATCSPRVLFKDGATAMLTTPRYVFEGGTIQQTVALFRDASAAERAFARLDGPANRRCIAAYTYAEVDARTEERVPPLTEQILNVEPFGQQSSAFRLSARVVSESAAVDILLNRLGRGISSVSVTWQPIPEDFALQEALLERIAARLRVALRAQRHARPM